MLLAITLLLQSWSGVHTTMYICLWQCGTVYTTIDIAVCRDRIGTQVRGGVSSRGMQRVNTTTTSHLVQATFIDSTFVQGYVRSLQAYNRVSVDG